MEALETLTPESNGAAARLRKLAGDVCDLDFTRPLAFFALALVYVASRIPWLDLGYGTDPDAWRVALTAKYLWAEGDYLPSRLPGYPLHEFVTAAMIQGGWVWTNLSTVFISLAGVYVFARLARELDLANRGALTVAFAFAPLLWINSVMTMDYMWALTFMLAAYLALLRRAPTLAGLSLGIAAGFRLQSLVMLLPFWLLLWRTGRREDLRPMTVTAAATALVAYTPVLMVYGIRLFNFYDQDVPLSVVTRQLGKEGLGVIGALAILGALALSLSRLRRLPDDLRRDPHVLTWAAVIVVFFVSYARLPHEIAYLIPVFPFAFFLMSRYLSRGVLVAALSVVILAGFVDITSPDDDLGVSVETFTQAGIGKGLLLSDIETLNNQMDFARELREFTITDEDVTGSPSVVIVGFIYPELVVLYEDELEIGILEDDLGAISQLSDKGKATDPERNIEYVWLVEYETFKELLENDRRMFFTDDAARSTYAVYGYRPGYLGAYKLPLSRDNPSVAKGTATSDR